MRLSVLALAFALPASAQTVTRVSVSSTGQEANGATTAVTVSESGRWVAMQSGATNLVAGDTNGVDDIFLHDRNWGTTTRVTATGGAEANGHCALPSMSGSGERVTFESTATNLVAGYGPASQVYVHDRVAGTTVAASSVAGNGASSQAQISLDGKWVVFQSDATNLVAGDTNGVTDVFLAEVATGATTRVSVGSGGEGNGASIKPTVSADGRWVTFVSSASNLVAGDTNGVDDVFLHDTLTGVTTRASVGSAGAQANGATVAGSISPDGGYVALASDATNLVLGDTNGARDVFVKVLGSGLVVRASVSSSGVQANGNSFFPGVSWYGSEVTFHTLASNLVLGDTNGVRDVYKHDLDSGVTTLISAEPGGTAASGTSWLADLDTGGRVTAFVSDAPDLVSGDTNGTSDAFVQLEKATWYIDVAGAGSGAGTPANPYTSIQYAIDRPQTVGGDALLVAAGTYYENVDLRGKPVELRSLSGKDTTILDGGQAGSVVTLASGEGPGTAIEGFTIENGSGVSTGYYSYGGGIYCDGADLDLSDCILQENSVQFFGRGGGLYARLTILSVANCIIQANAAEQGLGMYLEGSTTSVDGSTVQDHLVAGSYLVNPGTGIGIFCEGGKLDLLDSQILGNRLLQAGWTWAGGGVFASGADISVAECVVSNNATTQSYDIGGPGGGIYAVGGSVLIRDSSITWNAAGTAGGGIYADNATIERCYIAGNFNLDYGGGVCLDGTSVMRDCHVDGNSAAYEDHYGGGLYQYGGALLVDSCTFSWNLAAKGGAMIVGNATVVDCILANNVVWSSWGTFAAWGAAIVGSSQTAVSGCLIYNEGEFQINSLPRDGAILHGPMTLDRCSIYSSAFCDSSAIHDAIVSNSIIRNEGTDVEFSGTAQSIYSCVDGGYPGTGNIDEDPLFWDPEGGDFHLRPGSPCIDAGDPTSPLDPDGTIADMGAFPYDPNYCPPVTNYCTAGTTGNGCIATISAIGTASATASSGFQVAVDNVEGQKLGIIFWGPTSQAAPWGAGSSYLCVAAPVKRTGNQASGGTAGLCDGSFALDFNAWMAANPTKAPGMGEVVYMQAWFRDPPSPKTTSLSDGLRFVMCQ